MATDTIFEDEVPDYFRKLLSLPERMSLAEPMGLIGAIASMGLAEHILTSTSPAGVPYAPLKRPRPRGHNPSPTPLIDMGGLIQSLLSGSDHISDITNRSATVGTSHWKAIFHEEGTSRIPARPFIGISEETEAFAPEVLGGFIMRQFDAWQYH